MKYHSSTLVNEYEFNNITQRKVYVSICSLYNHAIEYMYTKREDLLKKKRTYLFISLVRSINLLGTYTLIKIHEISPTTDINIVNCSRQRRIECGYG